MKWTTSRIEKIMNEFVDQINNTFDYNAPYVDIPIYISNKMTRAMGKFTFISKSNGELVGKDFKFSYKLFENYSDDVIIDTIKHEYLHYLMIIVFGENMKHNEIFKAHCRELGVDDGTYFTAQAHTKHKRYVVHCPTCGELPVERDKLSSFFKDIINNNYICSTCKNEELKVFDRRNSEYVKL